MSENVSLLWKNIFLLNSEEEFQLVVWNSNSEIHSCKRPRLLLVAKRYFSKVIIIKILSSSKSIVQSVFHFFNFPRFCPWGVMIEIIMLTISNFIRVHFISYFPNHHFLKILIIMASLIESGTVRIHPCHCRDAKTKT